MPGMASRTCHLPANKRAGGYRIKFVLSSKTLKTKT